MIEVPLTKGKVALIDDEDAWITQWKWHYSNHRGGRAQRCIRTDGNKKIIYMHRVILNAPDDLQVDHINHDRLDNRKANLRLCTNSQNNMNRTKLGGCSSKYKGAYRAKRLRGNIWQSQIKLNGKSKNLGYFSSEEAAARAYNQAAQEHFGEYAMLNRLDDELGLAEREDEMMPRLEDYPDANWCPECKEPADLCWCATRDPYLDDDDALDGEPDFTLDELEWQETYPELCEDEI